MRIRLLAVLLAIGAAACSTTPQGGGTLASYQPTSGPYPYNSTICP